MRWVLNVIAALLLITGLVWILQGANILPGGFMAGQIEWLIAGIVVAIIGLRLLFVANRNRLPPPSEPGGDR